jgi:NitT/TauT family transport system substrate-binding protein
MNVDHVFRPGSASLLMLALVSGLLLAACQPASAPGPAQPSQSAAPAAAPTGAAGQSGAPARAPLTVRVATTGIDFGYLPLVVARVKGFLQAEGIEIQWEQMRANAAIPALLNNSVDYGQANSAIVASTKGAELRAVLFYYNTSTFQLSVNPRVTDPRQLAGQPVAIASPGGLQDKATRLMLQSLGVDPQSMSYIPLGDSQARVTAMLNGQVMASANNIDVTAELKKQGFVVLAESADLLTLPFSGWSARTDYIREQRDAVKRFIRANVRTLQFMRQNPDETADIASRELNLGRDLARDALPYVLKTMYPEDPGGFTEAGMREQLRIIQAEDPEVPDLPIEALADVTLLREVQRELGIQCHGGYKC